MQKQLKLPLQIYISDSIISEDNYLMDVSVELKDGNLHCTFDRPQLTNISSILFDLNDPFYLLVAKGPIKSDAFERSPLGKTLYHLKSISQFPKKLKKVYPSVYFMIIVQFAMIEFSNFIYLI